MSDVPNSSNKIQIEAVRYRSAGSESIMQSIGGATNYLLDAAVALGTRIDNVNFRFQAYTTAGAANFIVPTNVTRLMIFGMGGQGAGGAGGRSLFAGVTGGSGGGGGGCQRTMTYATVTPTQNISLTIGAGGIGGLWTAGGPQNGGDGTDTVFDTGNITGFTHAFYPGQGGFGGFDAVGIGFGGPKGLGGGGSAGEHGRDGISGNGGTGVKAGGAGGRFSAFIPMVGQSGTGGNGTQVVSILNSGVDGTSGNMVICWVKDV